MYLQKKKKINKIRYPTTILTDSNKNRKIQTKCKNVIKKQFKPNKTIRKKRQTIHTGDIKYKTK